MALMGTDTGGSPKSLTPSFREWPRKTGRGGGGEGEPAGGDFELSRRAQRRDGEGRGGQSARGARGAVETAWWGGRSSSCIRLSVTRTRKNGAEDCAHAERRGVFEGDGAGRPLEVQNRGFLLFSRTQPLKKKARTGVRAGGTKNEMKAQPFWSARTLRTSAACLVVLAL